MNTIEIPLSLAVCIFLTALNIGMIIGELSSRNKDKKKE